MVDLLVDIEFVGNYSYFLGNFYFWYKGKILYFKLYDVIGKFF